MSTASLLLLLCVAAVLTAGLGSSTPAKQRVPLKVQLAQGLIGAAFSFKPLYKAASAKARTGILANGRLIGVDWAERVENYRQSLDDLERRFERIKDAAVVTPDYYNVPFHAYDEGNLSWQAAMEVESAALTVHSNIYTPSRDVLELEGDAKLRESFHVAMKAALSERVTTFSPSMIVDAGCSTGLSTLKMAESFPSALVFGVDLSPFMLAVGEHDLTLRPQHSEARKRITYMHGQAESTSFGPDSIDLFTMSLVSHELPRAASRAVFQEAYRTLKPGGAFAFMDINPNSASFQKLAANPFAFQGFKSTEPWLQDYIDLDLEVELAQVGFVGVSVRSSSPRHRTVVAFKS